MSDLDAVVAAWRSGDCDPRDIARLDALLAAANKGDATAVAELNDAFARSLTFGTAGLRARMAPGPNRMNTAVVRRAAFALAHTLADTSRTAVIGYDARHRSRDFAVESARVLAAAGWRAALLPRALPTPVLAFAVRHLSADLGIMVTASHNPPADNGYKVYSHDGRQIIEPIDAQIAAAIEDAPVAREIEVSDDWVTLDDAILEAYLDTAARVVAADTPRAITVVHTALHGVGTDVFASAMRRAGFASPIEVSEQRDPDPDFPTVEFPNPEEPGALDLALVAARSHSADIVIAHDPDADRCAVAIPRDGETRIGTPAEPAWRMLTGDEVGALLGWWIIQRSSDPKPTFGAFAASVVSGRQLERIARAAQVPFATTLTGFKWISRVPHLRYGYEEALGYCVDPDHVADKDGITAGLLICELAADARARGSDLSGVLDQIVDEVGIEITRQVSLRFTDPDQARHILTRITADPPREIAGLPVTDIVDLAVGHDGLPPTPGLMLTLADHHDVHARVIIRPSGTEPKLKTYLQVEGVPVSDQTRARRAAEATMDSLEAGITLLVNP